jgi:hypothetical protein
MRCRSSSGLQPAAVAAARTAGGVSTGRRGEDMKAKISKLQWVISLKERFYLSSENKENRRERNSSF